MHRATEGEYRKSGGYNLISTWELWTFPQPNSGTTCSWPILKYNPYPAAFILLKLKDEQVIS